MKTICVIGLGYIGLPTASMFASHGIKVIGVDINHTIVDTIKNGKIHIYEPGLQEAVDKAIVSGNLFVSTLPEPADAFIIAVPTPICIDKTADMRAVISATESIVPHLKADNLVVLESTSPPRTTVNIVAPILARSGLIAGQDFHLAYSPERVLPGKILKELVENARVIGGINETSAEVGRDLYRTFVQGDIILTDATTAEMVKLMENTYRDVNIAVANEFARLADRFGIDIWEAIKIANLHPRVKILKPGPGVGGHCISVDPWFLVEAAPDLTALIHTARTVNDTQPHYVVDLVHRALKEIKGKRIAALGLAYKPDVDDLRESPAIEVVHLLMEEGAIVEAYEPYKVNEQVSDLKVAESFEDAIRSVDALLLLVAHQQFRALDPKTIATMTHARIVIDSVNGWYHESWRLAGFDVFRLGVNNKKTAILERIS